MLHGSKLYYRIKLGYGDKVTYTCDRDPGATGTGAAVMVFGSPQNQVASFNMVYNKAQEELT